MPATKERTYNDTEIAEKLKDLPGWYYEDGWIRRVYKTDGWPTTLMLVNAVGYLAEAAYHHPDLTVTWGRITVKLQNHAAGGITDKDFELARKIEEVVLWRPQGGAPAWTPSICPPRLRSPTSSWRCGPILAPTHLLRGWCGS